MAHSGNRRWSEAELELVAKLYRDGFSFEQISVRIGQATGIYANRNQIAGQCRKLGLSRSAESKAMLNTVNGRAANRKRKAALGIKPKLRPKLPPQQPLSEASAPLSEEQMESVVADHSIGVPLEDLTPHMCRVVISKTGEPIQYCGAPIIRDPRINTHKRPYCEFHLRRLRQNVPLIKKGKANAA